MLFTWGIQVGGEGACCRERGIWNTVEPLNKDTFGTSRFDLCREVVLFKVIFYSFQLVLCWEVCPLSDLECPLLEVAMGLQKYTSTKVTCIL